MIKYVPTIVLCLFVWITVIVARTSTANELNISRGFAIAVVAICWLTIGICVQRILDERR